MSKTFDIFYIRFEAYAILGQHKFPVAVGSTKKEAKLMAAEIAMKTIAIDGFANSKNLHANDRVT